ncbi:hypothetical protein Hanom_Chr05g00471921 [Helianthus anomalus]
MVVSWGVSCLFFACALVKYEILETPGHSLESQMKSQSQCKVLRNNSQTI